jgi:hypothetical protein
MTYADQTFMDVDDHEPRDRLAAFLSRQYRGEHRTKRLASDIDCTPKAAQNIMNGHWPNSRHMAAIVRRFGRDVVEAMFAPEIDDTVARLEAEVRQLEDQLEEKRRLARKVAGRPARSAPRLVALEDRSADPIERHPAP